MSNKPGIWIESTPGAENEGAPVQRAFPVEAVEILRQDGGIAAVEATARRHPDKVAIDDGTLTLTYAEFLDRVYGLATRLIDGWPAGSSVVSLVHNSAASPVIIMATAMAGHLLVPIDAAHPVERQAAILAESGAVALIGSTEPVDDAFVPADLPRLTIDAALPTGASRPTPRYDPHAPLFVAFTSGSTGRPKGIASGGQQGSDALAGFVERYRLGTDDVLLNLASLSVGGARDAFVALSAGALMRICDIRRGLTEILRVMDEEGVTILSFIPTALRMVLGIDGAERAFRHLRVLDLHGESILASDIALFRRKLPADCLISVTMGSLETGAVFSWFVDDARIDGTVVPVGHLLPGKRIALLDDDGQPVVSGEPGELFVRGPMAMGAWRGGAMVAGPFQPDPEDAASRVYNMGDLVRQRADGLFEFVGRKDRQVKIRGQWANLGEIEAAMRGMDGVADATVVAVSHPDEGDRLAAFLVMTPDVAAPTGGTVRRVVAAETAEHMAPATVMFLDAIPRLANLKPDLVRLTALAQG